MHAPTAREVIEIHRSECGVSSEGGESTTALLQSFGNFLFYHSVVLKFLGMSYKSYQLEAKHLFQFHDLLVYISITLILFYSVI